MKRKRLIAALLAVLCLLLCAACGESGGNGTTGASHPVKDCVDRTVQVPDDAQRVICMYASTAHMMAMLDVGDRIVGAADGITRDQMMTTKYPAIENVPTPYHEGSINMEEVMALDADLILVKKEMYWNEGEKEKLEKSGIPYLVVDYYSIDELKQAITVMGEAFQKTEKAEGYIAYMDKTFQMVKDRCADIPEEQKPRVFHSINQATKTDIVDSLCAEIIDMAGLVDVSSSAGVTDLGKNATVTLEQIYSWDPDAIICNEYAVADYILAQQRWNGLKAVQNKAVYTLPIGATRWCHHGSMEPQMGALFLAWKFWPDRFSDLDWNTELKTYYAEQFGMTLDDATIQKILSGRGMREQSPTLTFE